MVRVTRLNGVEIVVNASVIESLESTPDTVIRLLNGQRLAVRETVDEVIAKVISYQRELHQPMCQVEIEDPAGDTIRHGDGEES
ncbi:MAG: flagellar FlbD family protein [Proteobacteria bacterium]|nr:flagellar FlbD family protein [Pseudomonadota bacterium]